MTPANNVQCTMYSADSIKLPFFLSLFLFRRDPRKAGSKEVRVLHYYRPQYKGPRSTYRKSPDLKLQLLLLDRCEREGEGEKGGGDETVLCAFYVCSRDCVCVVFVFFCVFLCCVCFFCFVFRVSF